MSQSEESDTSEVEGDQSLNSVVKMLTTQANLLCQSVTTKISFIENLKREMEQMNDSEKALRMKLVDESEQVRRENGYLHKALGLLEEQAYLLCEENRQYATTIEKQKEKEAEMSLMQGQLELDLKNLCKKSNIDDPKPKVFRLFEGSSKSLKDLLKQLQNLHNLLQVQKQTEGCLRNEVEHLKGTVNDLKMDNESQLMHIDCLGNQIKAQETEIDKLAKDLKTCKKQITANLEQERNEINRLNSTISCLQGNLNAPTDERLESMKNENASLKEQLARFQEDHKLKSGEIHSITATNDLYQKQINHFDKCGINFNDANPRNFIQPNDLRQKLLHQKITENVNEGETRRNDDSYCSLAKNFNQPSISFASRKRKFNN